MKKVKEQKRTGTDKRGYQRFACFCVDVAFASSERNSAYQILTVSAKNRQQAAERSYAKIPYGHKAFLLANVEEISGCAARMRACGMGTALFGVKLGMDNEVLELAVVLVEPSEHAAAEKIGLPKFRQGFHYVMARNLAELEAMARDLIEGAEDMLRPVQPYVDGL